MRRPPILLCLLLGITLLQASSTLAEEESQEETSPLMMMRRETTEKKRTNFATSQEENRHTSREEQKSYLYNASIEKMPPPTREAILEATRTIESQNKIIEAVVNLLNQPARAKQTMACLRCFDFNNVGDYFTSLASVNTVNQGDVYTTQFILNNRENNQANGGAPFTFTVLSSGDQDAAQVITSPIIPQDIESNLSGVKPSHHSNNPSAEENEQVRKYVFEAFEDYLGTEAAQACLPDFLTEDNKGKPFFIQLPDNPPAGSFSLADAFSNLDNYVDSLRVDQYAPSKASSIEAGRNQLEYPSALLPSIPRSIEQLSYIEQIRDPHNQSMALYSRATNPEEYQKALLKVLYHAADTIVRGAGVAASTTAGAVIGAVAGAAGGGMIGLFFGSVATFDMKYAADTATNMNAYYLNSLMTSIGMSLSISNFESHHLANLHNLVNPWFAEGCLMMGSIVTGSVAAHTIYATGILNHVDTSLIFHPIIGGAVGASSVGALYAAWLGARNCYSYFSPHVAAQKFLEALHDFRNPPTLPSVINSLEEALLKDQELQTGLGTFLDTISEQKKEHFLTALTAASSAEAASILATIEETSKAVPFNSFMELKSTLNHYIVY